MSNIRSQQWRDENEPSKFPFEDNAGLTSDQGDVLLEGMFLDAILHPAGSAGGLYISKVTIGNTQCVISIGDLDVEEICTATFSILSPPDSVPVVDAYGRSAGVLVSESLRLANFQAWALGEHTFTSDQAPFVASVCVPLPATGVEGFLLEDGTVVSGDVWLVGGDGVALSVRSLTVPDGLGGEKDLNAIRVDLVGDPLYKRKLCAPGLFETPRFLRRVVFQKGKRLYVAEPNARGDIQITVGSSLAEDTILRIRPQDYGVLFEMVGEKLQDIR